MKSRADVGALGVLLGALTVFACRQEMHDQARYEPFEASSFFPDRLSARLPVEGTVARGDLEDASVARPTRALLQRGRERFDIFCSPCHDRLGFGRGVIVRRGFPAPPSYHDAIRRELTPAAIVEVITNGKGDMYSYASRVPPRDRWAIAHYVKALQLSQHATLDDVPEDERQDLMEKR